MGEGEGEENLRDRIVRDENKKKDNFIEGAIMGLAKKTVTMAILRNP